MKVIDLLNKIANGEIPEKIKFIGKIWEYDDSVNDYSYFLIDHYEYFFNNISFSYINDEVEIVEDTPKEDKKIENLGAFNIKKFYYDYPETAHFILEMFKKQEELIDRLNGE